MKQARENIREEEGQQMEERKRERKERRAAVRKGIFHSIITHPKQWGIGLIVVLILVGSIILRANFKNTIESQSNAVKLGLENIGELATQSAYCTEINVTKATRELFGLQIPFTQSKYIYSYDVEIKAGVDFAAIDWKINQKKKEIHIKMPEAKVLTCAVNLDSFKVYHEDESIFRQISLKETNKAIAKLEKDAQKTSISNGLLENAQANGKTILKKFFEVNFDSEGYTIIFDN